jgi:hypothetical protein
LNPSETSIDDEAINFLKRNNKVQFKRDNVDVLFALPFELMALIKTRDWETFRTGYFSFGASFNVFMKTEDG